MSRTEPVLPAGLYAITPDTEDTPRLLADVAAAIAGGLQWLQYRSKSKKAGLRHAQATALAQLCRTHGVNLIINDDLALALACDCRGVHLGATDGSLAQARALAPRPFLIGASCYDSLDLAQAAVAAGADYVAFGSFFSSSIKPDAVRPALTLLTQARATLPVPIVAIGGITLAQVAALRTAGADAVAVVTALFAAPDICETARLFNERFEGHHGEPQRRAV